METYAVHCADEKCPTIKEFDTYQEAIRFGWDHVKQNPSDRLAIIRHAEFQLVRNGGVSPSPAHSYPPSVGTPPPRKGRGRGR